MRALNVMVSALLLCCGFGSAYAMDTESTEAKSSPSAEAHDKVMDLELAELDGTQFLRLSAYVGKPMVVNFWGSFCPPCVAEMPMLQQQALKYPGVQFLGIAVDDRLKARAFLQSQTVTYPQLLAPGQSDGIMRRFGDKTGALPYTVVLDVRHRLCASKAGGIDSNWLADSLRHCAPSNL